MSTLQLRHKATGLPVIGTFERIPGCANVTGFTRTESGQLEPVYESDTDVWWDNQETETDVMTGQRYFVLDGGDVVSEDECEVVPADEAQAADEG